jgi:two-component system, NtrC family, sensor kinase
MTGGPDVKTIINASRSQRQKRPTPLAPLKISLLALMAFGLLWFLYGKTQLSSPASRDAVQVNLRLLQQIDSDWNVDIMSSKVGLIDSYDPIVAPYLKIRSILSTLSAHDGALDSEVSQQLSAMRELFATKADLVDEFKSHNSILRNSLRFLPTAAGDAKASVLSMRSKSREQGLSAVSGEIEVTLSEALRYALITDRDQQIRLNLLTQHLQEVADGLAGDSLQREPLRVFVNHSNTILRSITNEANLLSGITRVKTVVAIEKSATSFERYFARQSTESELWRKVLVGYSVFLLTLTLFTLNRLRQSYLQINSMNTALLRANDTLEQRVRERTGELQHALVSLRESEVQLIQSEKMSSLGQMIAGVAHEINTPLAYVRSSLETVGDHLADVDQLVRQTSSMLGAISSGQDQVDKSSIPLATLSALTSNFMDNAIPDELAKIMGDSIHGLDQISEIVLSLRNFSRLDRSKMSLFDLREGLDSTLVIARGTLKGHRVVKQYSTIPKIHCNPSQMNQVFLNLISNAAQALPGDGGTITLSTHVDGEMVRVDASDTGHGIDARHLDKIFDPFFTTKEIGKGTGLGLSIAYKIVQEHGGRIAVRSQPGQGTTFSVYLPVKTPAA